jgi:uncharacterized protein (TIGR00255 family)
MTGYGKAVAELPNRKITVEIKSLNSKQFDLTARLPSVYREKEIALRNLLARRLIRGKVALSVNVEMIAKDMTSMIDRDMLSRYHREVAGLAAELNIPQPVEWFSVLLRLPDVMRQEQEELSEEEYGVIEQTVDRAVDETIAFRRQEGVMLEQVLTEKVDNIRALLKAAESFEEERICRIKNRIREGLNGLDGIEYDKNRFEQELIYYIEKLDVNEEKNRLAHHLDYLATMLEEKESQGKKLGFITQEIGREINTLGSKCNQSDIQRIVVQMKDELEQMKEQILNIL